MKKHSTLRTLLAAMALAVALAACIVPVGPGARYYILNPVESDTVIPRQTSRELRVEISELELPTYLNRAQIVVRSTGQQMQIMDQDHWAGDLRENLARVLAKNLSLQLATPNVSLAPNSDLETPDFRLRLRVLEFERGADQRVRLAARWRVYHGGSRQLLTSRLTELSSEPLVPGESNMNPAVMAMGRLLGELCGQISSVLASTPVQQAMR